MAENTQAETKEEFTEAWQSHINQLYKIGHSLPEEEVEDFMDAIEDVEEFVTTAAEHTFNEDK